LNARPEFGPGTYAFVNTGVIGTDAIKLALIYKPAKVSLASPFSLLTAAVDARFNDAKNRPALAQTFTETGTGARFTVVLNHLKSKGSDCIDVGDPDLGDGQGNCNQTRTSAAAALVDWAASLAALGGDPDVVIMGDLNAHAMEDPITTLTAGGFQSLPASFMDPQQRYSYQFQGQTAHLDHALANGALAPQVTGATFWHSNTDEPVVLDYNLEFKTDDPFTADDPFRASDHDGIIFGLNLTGGSVPVPAGGGLHLVGLLVLLLAVGALVLKNRPASK
jgi:predicted extracellular nuclease